MTTGGGDNRRWRPSTWCTHPLILCMPHHALGQGLGGSEQHCWKSLGFVRCRWMSWMSQHVVGCCWMVLNDMQQVLKLQALKHDSAMVPPVSGTSIQCHCLGITQWYPILHSPKIDHLQPCLFSCFHLHLLQGSLLLNHVLHKWKASATTTGNTDAIRQHH